MSTIPTGSDLRLAFSVRSPIESENAGLFISRGIGRHPDRVIASHELIVVTAGTLRLSEEGRDFTVDAGEYLILVPGVRHWAKEDYPPGLEFYWLHFRIVTDDRGGAGRNPVEIDVARHGQVGDPERMEELFRWFLDAQEKQDLDPKLARMLCLTMLFVLDHRGRRPSADDERVPMLVRQAKRILARCFQEELSTSLIARRLTCNPDYLGRLYRRHFGASIMEDLHGLRIRLARKMLMDEHLNVNEVAVRCGYRDATFFRRMFKRLVGLTPKAFRNLYSHMHINTQ